MTLKDFTLTEDNHFIAMEYYALILNRTFLVLLTKEYLIGIQGNGMIGVEGGNNELTKVITGFKSCISRLDIVQPARLVRSKPSPKAHKLHCLCALFHISYATKYTSKLVMQSYALICSK